MADDPKEKTVPAYIPPKTLFNFVNALRDTGLPSQINKSVMTNLSYSTQAQLLASMRFLALIDTQGKPQAILARLVEAGEADQAAVIKEILGAKYGFVFDSLDLTRVTPEELEKAFKQEGISGTTVARAVGFFLGAADAAGIALSPHLKKRTTTPGTPRRSRAVKKGKKKAADAELDRKSDPETPSATVSASYQDKLLDKFPTFDPTWPDAIKAKWFEGFDQFMKGATAPKA